MSFGVLGFQGLGLRGRKSTESGVEGDALPSPGSRKGLGFEGLGAFGGKTNGIWPCICVLGTVGLFQAYFRPQGPVSGWSTPQF